MTGNTYLDDSFLPDVLGLEPENAEALRGLLTEVEQQFEASSFARIDDTNSKRIMIAHNLRVVGGIAKGYTNRGVAFLDLIREGIQGLIQALKQFEFEGGFRFSTYAKWCIQKKIELAISNQNNQLGFHQP